MSSFSLPSASGMVSLLNDGRSSKVNSKGKDESGPTDMHLDSSSYRNGSASSSSVNSPLNSALEDSSTNGSKSSLSSTLTSQSSDSAQSGKSGEMNSLCSLMEGQHAHSISRGASSGDDDLRTSSEPCDGDKAGKRSRMKRKQEIEEWSERSMPQNDYDTKKKDVLHQDRLAASPQPMESSPNPKNVPVNMEEATHNGKADGSTRNVKRDTASEGGVSPAENVHQAGTGAGGKRRYPCSHAGCDKTFSTSGHAARHNRIHTGA
jgi:hypothetical protein